MAAKKKPARRAAGGGAASASMGGGRSAVARRALQERNKGIVFGLVAALIGMLVIYCLKDVAPLVYPFALPELVAVASVVAMQAWKRSALLSIPVGTAVYMILIRLMG